MGGPVRAPGVRKGRPRGLRKTQRRYEKEKIKKKIFSLGGPQRGPEGPQWAWEGPQRGSGSPKKQKRKKGITHPYIKHKYVKNMNMSI
jgi:hypothetical protein